MAKLGFISVKVGEDLDLKIQKLCDENDITVSQVVRAALREYFARKGAETNKESV